MGDPPYGPQPLRVGLHSWRRPQGSINIYHKETNINNFGSIWSMPYNYVYCDPGLSKGAKWGLGITGVLGLATTFVTAFMGSKGGKGGGTEEVTADQTTVKPQTQVTRPEVSDDVKVTEEPADTNPVTQTVKPDETEKPDNSTAPVASAERLPSEQQYDEFTVKAEKIKGTNKYRGHTGFDIVAAKYKTEDGQPLTRAEVDAICAEIFKGKALPTGTIKLPLEVTTPDGKTYKCDTSVKSEDVPPKAEYTLANISTYSYSAKQVDGKWYPTIDRERVGTAVYDSEKEAIDAAKKEIERRKSEESK